MKKTLKADLAKKLCDKFPNTSSRELGRLLQKKYPTRFLTFGSAYGAVRYARGASGSEKRKYRKSEPTKHKGANEIVSLPEPLVYDKTPKFVRIDGKRILILSDIHCPFQNNKALDVALKYGENKNCDTIIINGDLIDFFNISSFVKEIDVCDTAEEISKTKRILQHIRGRFPKAEILYKLGNHEDRFQRYMSIHAPEFLDIEDFKLEKVLSLSQYKIKCVDSHTIIKICDKLNCVHGHEFRNGVFGNPVNAARTLFLRTKGCCICGHFHSTSKHSEKNIDDKIVSTWSIGCLCDLRPTYSPINNWNNGFAYVEVDDEGGFVVENKEIINGKAY